MEEIFVNECLKSQHKTPTLTSAYVSLQGKCTIIHYFHQQRSNRDSWWVCLEFATTWTHLGEVTSQTLQIPLQSNANIEDMCQPDLPTLYTECQYVQTHTMNPSLKNLLTFARRSHGAAKTLPNLLPRAIDKCVATQPRCPHGVNQRQI